MAKIGIIVYGNIASGKSTFCRLLSRELIDFEYVCLDDIRRENLDRFPDMNSLARERLNEKHLLDIIGSLPKVIYETTAATQIYSRAKREIIEKHFVYVDCPVDICIERFYSRGNRQILPDYRNKLALPDLMRKFRFEQSKMRNDLILRSDKINPQEMCRKAMLYLKSVL